MNLDNLEKMRSLVARQTPNSNRAQLEKQMALQNIATMIEKCKAKV